MNLIDILLTVLNAATVSTHLHIKYKVPVT